MKNSQSFLCPSCGNGGRPVKEITLRSLLREEFRGGIGDRVWHFCTTSECPLVYFDAGGASFHKDQLAVRVGIKETTAPRPVCYCFHHSVEEIEDDIARTGATGVPDDIRTRMKEACWCETTSPMGSCCLATVNGFVKEALSRSGHAPPAASTETQDCCAADAEHAKQESAAPPNDRTGLWAGIGAVLAAMASSACCWLPLLLLAFGASAVGVATFLEAWRGWFLGSAAILLALGFYLSYFRKSACKPGDACAAPTPGLRRVNRAMLWVAAAFVAVFAFFPNTLGLLHQINPAESQQLSTADLESLVLSVQGMTCEACAIGIEKALAERPDIASARVDYAAKKVTIQPAPGHALSIESIDRTIRELGYQTGE